MIFGWVLAIIAISFPVVFFTKVVKNFTVFIFAFAVVEMFTDDIIPEPFKSGLIFLINWRRRPEFQINIVALIFFPQLFFISVHLFDDGLASLKNIWVMKDCQRVLAVLMTIHGIIPPRKVWSATAI